MSKAQKNVRDSRLTPHRISNSMSGAPADNFTIFHILQDSQKQQAGDMTTIRPLLGVTIVEAVGTDAAQPLSMAVGMCGRIAADLGARVIRMENGASDGIDADTRPFLSDGKEILLASDPLVAVANVLPDCQAVVCDTGLRDRLALAPSDPDTIGLAMARDDPSVGTELTIEARSGLLDMIGEPDRQPLRLGGHQLSYAAGMSAYLALIDALTARASGGARSDRRVDVLEVGIWLNWKTIGSAALGLPVPSRTGRNAEWAVVPCEDGFVALVYRSSDWDALKTMLANPELDDPRFETDADRRVHRLPLNNLLERSLAHLNRSDIRKLALQHRLPLGPVWTHQELLNDPHMRERRFFQNYEGQHEGPVRPAIPVVWNGERMATHPDLATICGRARSNAIEGPPENIPYGHQDR